MKTSSVRSSLLGVFLSVMSSSSIAADEPLPLHVERDSEGPRIRLICGNAATDARMALLPQYPEVQSVAAYGSTDFTDAGLAPLMKLPQLKSLAIGSRNFTAAGLAHLSEIATLRSLMLNETPLTEQAAIQLARSPNLETLRLKDNPIEPTAWPALAKMPRLRELSIQNNRWSDADIAGLREFTRLESLTLGSQQFTVAALGHIGNNSALRSLTLNYFPLTDAGAERIVALPRLESLTVIAPPVSVTPSALSVLAKHPQLRHLNIPSGPPTDADLTALESLTRLRRLDLGHETTPAKLHQLRAALPNTIVNPYQLNYTIADLKAVSKDLAMDSAGNVAYVNQSCQKYATDEKLKVLAAFPTIVRMRIFGTITDAGLAWITKLPKIEKLEIKSSTLTDAGLIHLRSLTALRELLLQAPMVTAAGLAELQRALPECAIEVRPKVVGFLSANVDELDDAEE